MQNASNRTTHYRSERDSRTDRAISCLYISVLPKAGRFEASSYQDGQQDQDHKGRDSRMDKQTRFTELEIGLMVTLAITLFCFFGYIHGFVGVY